MLVVVNPTIQLRWIMQHWSNEDKIAARQVIVEMVCCSQ